MWNWLTNKKYQSINTELLVTPELVPIVHLVIHPWHYLDNYTVPITFWVRLEGPRILWDTQHESSVDIWKLKWSSGRCNCKNMSILWDAENYFSVHEARYVSSRLFTSYRRIRMDLCPSGGSNNSMSNPGICIFCPPFFQAALSSWWIWCEHMTCRGFAIPFYDGCGIVSV